MRRRCIRRPFCVSSCTKNPFSKTVRRSHGYSHSEDSAVGNRKRSADRADLHWTVLGSFEGNFLPARKDNSRYLLCVCVCVQMSERNCDVCVTVNIAEIILPETLISEVDKYGENVRLSYASKVRHSILDCPNVVFSVIFPRNYR